MRSFSKFRLRWNNHLSNFVGSLGSILKSENYSDVTVYCEGHVWQLHRLVLSASSSHFDQLLNSIPIGLTPGIILDGPSVCDVEAIIQFIYHGEVSIHQDLLPSLLRTASSLKIKGLADVSLVDTEASMDEHSVSLNYNQCSPGKVDRMCHVRREDSDMAITTLSEIYELSPLNLSRHQSTVQNKVELTNDERLLKGIHKRLAYFDNNEYQKENVYGHQQPRYHVSDDLASPPFKKQRSTTVAPPEQQVSPNDIETHDAINCHVEETPYDLSTNSGSEKELDNDSSFHAKIKIKEENRQLQEDNNFDSKTANKIQIPSSNISPQAIDRYQYHLSSQPDKVHLVCKNSPVESPSSKVSLHDVKTENENYVHLKKRIPNLEKQISSLTEATSVKNSESPDLTLQDTNSSKCPTYTDASVGPSDEVTETFNHKKFSHCTILSSGDAIHVVRGVYNSNLLNGNSYKLLNAKTSNEGSSDCSTTKACQPVLPTTTFPLSASTNTGVVQVKQEGVNVNNNSILMVSSTSPNISSPVSTDHANSPGSKSDDKSAGEGSDNDTYVESGTMQGNNGTASEGTGQGSQRVTINMRTFKEEWRRQLLVDYDSRTNMSICMLCFTTFKSYDGPRKNTYVKHAKRFHPALDEYSDKEREVIINMYEKYHKYDIDMQKEINKSFRTPNGPGCVSKRSGKIIDAASLVNCAQNITKVGPMQKETLSMNCDWSDKLCQKAVAESETDELNTIKNITDNSTIKPVLNSSTDVQFSNVSASNCNPEKTLGESNSAKATRRK